MEMGLAMLVALVLLAVIAVSMLRHGDHEASPPAEHQGREGGL